jgi:sugar transferase (PEP-CTERM system associated)
MLSSSRPDASFSLGRLLPAAVIACLIAFPAALLIQRAPVDADVITKLWSVAPLVGLWLTAVFLIQLLFTVTARRTAVSRRVLIVGEPGRVDALSARLRQAAAQRFEPVTSVKTPLSWHRLMEQQVSTVIVAAGATQDDARTLLDCKLRGMNVVSDLAFQEKQLGRMDLDVLTVDDLLLSDGFVEGTLSQALKRASDIVFSIGMLLLTLPLMTLTALAIKIDSPGPVFYRQQRIGYFGRPFTLLKFRSMSVDAEAGGAARWAQKQDPRVTKVGAFIRATRIDELPQLANVLRGEMSMVGPRPERPVFVEQLARVIPFYRERSYVKPGLTGWAQVNFPYGASVEDAREKLTYDLYYVKHRSLLLDLFILLSTVRVVVSREGAR